MRKVIFTQLGWMNSHLVVLLQLCNSNFWVMAHGVSSSILSVLISKHYHLEVQKTKKKNGTKNPMISLASMGKTGLSNDIFLKFSLRPFEVIEVEWWLMLNYEAETSKFCNCFLKFGSSHQKGKVDLCKISQSSDLFDFAIFHILLVMHKEI